MDFIPVISDPFHPRLKVPWFGPKDKLYKPGGLETWLFYPHYEGFNIQHIVEGNFDGKSWDEAASFLQRWAYWGTILEILRIGGPQNWEQPEFDVSRTGEDQLQSYSHQLPYMILLWTRIRVDSDNPEADKISEERFIKICVILKRVNVIYTLLCNREYSKKLKDAENTSKPRKAMLMHGSHSHKDEEFEDWDDYAKEELGGERSFFTDEVCSGGSPYESPGHALLLSIGAVGEFLSRATELKYDRKIENLKWTVPLTVVRRMHLAGWCPTWLRRQKDEGSIIRAYYLSCISRGRLEKHSRCCSFGCIASQVQETSYKMKHTTEGCTCARISFALGESSEYATWIKDGHTPLIVRTRINGEMKWELTRSHDPTTNKPKRYVAMSHVWIDGAGSVDGNALFSCQLDKFQNGATELYSQEEGDIPFWCDTICVPFNKGTLKMMAIRQMAKVYRDAESVLVFDASLQQVAIDTLASECLTRVEISAWNERLWTIQEAVFAKQLYFRFKNGTESLQSLLLRYRLERFGRLGVVYRENKAAEGPPLLNMILEMHLKPVLKKNEDPFQDPTGITAGSGKWLAFDADALEKPPTPFEMEALQLDTIFLGTVVAVSTFFDLLHSPPEGSELAQLKWNALEKVLPYRQTSIASDEGLCIATLLGMDLAALYDLPDHERVRRMFLYTGRIRSGLLFGQRARLDQPGCRWMPSSFVNQRIERLGHEAEITEQGVKVTLPGLMVQFPPGRFLSPVAPGNIAGPFGFVELDDEDGPGHLVAGTFPIHLSGTKRVYAVSLLLPASTGGITASSSRFIIILEQPLAQDSPVPAFQSPIRTILREWGSLSEKSVVEAFLVEDPNNRRPFVSYSVPAVIQELVDDASKEQMAAAGFATPLGEVEWLIS
ncbi:hypothetical protein BKA56DRAFT_614033 [Ilyonectria sp. MPI-CAGE-AT-0026]|nr:hypothetical protein BKA56DRAFT_614033 [Ilyonectria sp. MPI-CAGE-AT-0026]